MTNLSDRAKTKIHELSGGMKQRLGIAQAFLGDPEVIIVDEPTAGLDPEERTRFRNLLAEISMGKTVILSTHIVSDIEDSCYRLSVLDHGKILYLRRTARSDRRLSRQGMGEDSAAGGV